MGGQAIAMRQGANGLASLKLLMVGRCWVEGLAVEHVCGSVGGHMPCFG